MAEEKSQIKHLTPQEWEALIEDFHYGDTRIDKWTSRYTLGSIVDLAIWTVVSKKEFVSLKLHVLTFLDEFADLLFIDRCRNNSSNDDASDFANLIDSLRIVIQSPVDGVSVTFSVKECMLVTVTSIFISCCNDDDDDDETAGFLKIGVRKIEGLVEVLLGVVNKPNHGLDRQTRAVACECLRELERAYPCLLSEVAGHLWSLCQNERTHASQSYILLFAMVVRNIVLCKLSLSILNTSFPLVPFNVPQWMVNDGSGGGGGTVGYCQTSKDTVLSNSKEIRRAMAFLLEWPQVLTPCGMMEFMVSLLPVAQALELQASMLKVQFFGRIYSYNPMLCHLVLMIYLNFIDGFSEQEGEIAKRLLLISKETQNNLVFRLLALHWLLGLIQMVSDRGKGENKPIAEMGLNFYPTVFDPLALKSMKLDLLALCSRHIDMSVEDSLKGALSKDVIAKSYVVKVFEEGLVSVSSFKWLPPWSTETAVASRCFHKFLIGASSHSDTDPSTTRVLMESKIFHKLQRMLVDLTLESSRLVPVVLSFIDRLLGCHKHQWTGERLLQTFDEYLLSKVAVDYTLASYFPMFDRIADNETIPPRRLLELLTNFMVYLAQNHDVDTGSKSWSQGSKVLGICRTMMMCHHTSRLFLRLSRLLAFASLYFPDLEVRDNARIYLRMLMCIPGKKLRYILKLGEQFTSIQPSPLSSSYYNVQSPRAAHNMKKSRNISSYIHLDRSTPLLVQQSWSLSLPGLGNGDVRSDYLDGIKDSEPQVEEEEGEFDASTSIDKKHESERVGKKTDLLRVMDSRIAEILQILRRHFSCIPDFRYASGLKVKISCNLRFQAEPFNSIWRADSLPDSLTNIDSLPAIYATVLTFTSSAPYGSIPSCCIPFLLGQPPITDYADTGTLEIVPAEEGFNHVEGFKAPVVLELEPREPMPGLVDVSIETNADNGQIIRGQLRNVTVGIEDMFLKPIVPPDVLETDVSEYYSDLFNALWEVCDSSSHTGHETFPLKGGKSAAAVSGTRSVKLLEVPAVFLIQATEQHLAQFVASVEGESLVDMVRNNGIITGAVWKDNGLDESSSSLISTGFSGAPLQLKYINEEEDTRESYNAGFSKRKMGSFNVLIFLPPRFHLLLQMEVCDVSTLVRIRTDHWPCLAYIDDYLEALFLA